MTVSGSGNRAFVLSPIAISRFTTIQRRVVTPHVETCGHDSISVGPNKSAAERMETASTGARLFNIFLFPSPLTISLHGAELRLTIYPL